MKSRGMMINPYFNLQLIFEIPKKKSCFLVSYPRDACSFPVLIICTLIAERKLMLPSPWMLFVRHNKNSFFKIMLL